MHQYRNALVVLSAVGLLLCTGQPAVADQCAGGELVQLPNEWLGSEEFTDFISAICTFLMDALKYIK